MKYFYYLQKRCVTFPIEKNKFMFIEAKNEKEFYQILINNPFKYHLCYKTKIKNKIYLNDLKKCFRHISYKLKSKKELKVLFTKIITPEILNQLFYKQDNDNFYYHIIQIK